MNSFDKAWVLLKDDNWYDQYPNRAMSMTDSELEGHSMAFVESYVDHPNWQTFKEAGYPWDRIEEFFGLEAKQLYDVTNEMGQEFNFRQDEDTRPHVDDTDIDFAPEVFMEHERDNIVNRLDGGHNHEMLPTFGNVNINEPAPIDGVRVGRDMQNIPLHDGEEDVFSPWNERYKGERIGPHSRTPFSEQDQMKYTSEPFDQAWDLLKGEYEDIPKEEHKNYRKGSLNALPGHKPGCDLRLNGYYPHYSHRKYSGECTCEAQCVNCGAKEKWGYPHHDTDLCFDCTENMTGQGVIDNPLIDWMHSQPGGGQPPKTDDESWKEGLE